MTQAGGSDEAPPPVKAVHGVPAGSSRRAYVRVAIALFSVFAVLFALGTLVLGFC